jgi:hypothetical protein
MDKACSRNGRKRNTYKICWQYQKERSHYEDEDISWWIILKLTLYTPDRVVWTGLIWLRIENGVGLLLTL